MSAPAAWRLTTDERPLADVPVLAMESTDSTTPIIALWSPDTIVNWGSDAPDGSVWHDGHDGNPDGDGELHAPPGWWVKSHSAIDGGEYDYYWIGETEYVVRWMPLPDPPP